MQLLTADFDRLVSILSGQPDWRSERDRLRFVSDIFAGSSREKDILSLLDLGGTPRGAAVTLVTFLQDFGQDEPGRETLGLMINKLLAYLGYGDDADFLRGLLQRYPFVTRPVATAALAEWRGSEQEEDVLEKIIGENTLRHVMMLELALEVSPAVARITTSTSYGSGFMIADDLLMTNNHVLSDREEANASSFAFNYQLDRFHHECPTMVYSAHPDGLFYTNQALDFSVVQLQNAPDGIEPLQLHPRRVMRDARVSIIQHPGGHYKKISIQNNFVAYADGQFVQYTTSTEPGSSGSPVFDDTFTVIAIHHSGGMLLEPATQRRYLRNEGISMMAVVENLRQHASDIFDQLHIVQG